MQATYDPEADAAYISFCATTPVRQVHLDDSRVLDYAADDVLVGIELLSPSRGVDMRGMPRAAEVESAVRRLGFVTTVDQVSHW